MKLLRRFLAPLLALCFALTSAPVGALPPARTAAILSGVQGWSFQGSSVDLYFARNGGSCAVNRLLKPCASLLTTTRASTGYAQWADGHLSSFAANVPRITDLGLLVEQAATNVSLQSQAFDNASWAVSGGGVVTANTAVAPDGTTTADKLDDEDAAQVSEITGTATIAADTNNYTASIYFKKQPGATNYVRFRFRFDGSHACSAVVNLSTGVISANENTGSTYVSSSITSAGNYWHVTLTGVNASITSPAIRINPAYNTDGTNTASAAAVGFVEAWGAQIELGSFATSYIPTTTVAVTRAADSIPLAGPALAAALASKSAYAQTNALNPNSTNSNDMVVYFASGGQQLRFGGSTVVAADNGVNAIASSTIGGSGTFAGRVKVAYGYDASSYTAIANGGTQGVTASPWGTLTGTVSIGNRSSDLGRPINGYLERLAFGAVKGQYDRMTVP